MDHQVKPDEQKAMLFDKIEPLFDPIKARLQTGDIPMIMLLKREDAGDMLTQSRHLGTRRAHIICQPRHIAANGPEMLKQKMFNLVLHRYRLLSNPSSRGAKRRGDPEQRLDCRICRPASSQKRRALTPRSPLS
jgi:hypothetical protein